MIRHVTLACVACACLCQTSFTARASEPVAASEPGTTVAQASAELKSRREELARLQAEVARLEELTGEFEKVTLTCRFIETDAAGLAELGIDRDELSSNSTFDRPANELPPSVATAARRSRALPRLFDRPTFDAAIESMTVEGTAMQLAKRTVIAVDGRRASIHVGGEFPMLVPHEKGTTVVQWRSFGDRIDATCRILGGGKLHLECTADHTWRDFSNAVVLSGIVIPGLTTRRVNFESEMEFGRALVVMVPGAWVQSEVRSRNPDADADTPARVCLCVITAEPVSNDGR